MLFWWWLGLSCRFSTLALTSFSSIVIRYHRLGHDHGGAGPLDILMVFPAFPRFRHWPSHLCFATGTDWLGDGGAWDHEGMGRLSCWRPLHAYALVIFLRNGMRLLHRHRFCLHLLRFLILRI
jgi:hypothetical protein